MMTEKELPITNHQLPLSYCTNVHPAKTLEDVKHSLETYTLPIREKYAHPLAAGLWLARSVTKDLLANPTALLDFAAFLRSHNLPVYTLNAFPFGDFHQVRVKENVYLPNWTNPQRLAYTQDCATILAELLPPPPMGVDGSISTMPLGFKPITNLTPAFYQNCITHLLTLARFLHDLHQRTGKIIRLAIEPEPLCLLETTPETLTFFTHLFQQANKEGIEPLARQHLGLCFDVCHQAVEFEDIPASLTQIHAAGIRINKVHLSAALRIENPATNPEARRALAQYIEPRYQHQVAMQNPTLGKAELLPDLDPSILNPANVCLTYPQANFATAPELRIHFHVPINLENLSPLQTTRDQLPLALQVITQLPYAPHLEVETYTWPVMTDSAPTRIINGLADELLYARTLLRS